MNNMKGLEIKMEMQKCIIKIDGMDIKKQHNKMKIYEMSFKVLTLEKSINMLNCLKIFFSV
jgi:hypothetical protein